MSNGRPGLNARAFWQARRTGIPRPPVPSACICMLLALWQVDRKEISAAINSGQWVAELALICTIDDVRGGELVGDRHRVPS
jgi:hypothetical protein